MRDDFKAIVALDFDGTIAETDYPKIIRLKNGAKEYINKLYSENYCIQINTCRTEGELRNAIDFLNQEDVKFHLANENHPTLIEYFIHDSRKLSYDISFDDKDIYFRANPQSLNWRWFYHTVKSITNKKDFKSILKIVQENV